MSNSTPDARAADASASIGSASMDQARTIFLQLRAEGPNGEIGDAMFTYKPGDPNHRSRRRARAGRVQADAAVAAEVTAA